MPVITPFLEPHAPGDTYSGITGERFRIVRASSAAEFLALYPDLIHVRDIGLYPHYYETEPVPFPAPAAQP